MVVANGVRVERVDEVNSPEYDAVVLVVTPDASLYPPPQALEDFVLAAIELDNALLTSCEPAVLACARVAGGRLVLAPTGPVTPYHDVRSIGEAMGAGVRRAARAGARRVCVCVAPHGSFPRAPLVALLAALEATYQGLQAREWSVQRKRPLLDRMGVYAEGLPGTLDQLIVEAAILERARGVCRDIAGADPERMTPARAAQLVRTSLRSVRVRVIEDAATIESDYPLFAAVNRCAGTVERHRGRIVFLEYTGAEYDRTVMLVGKGVTYDTGGCDLKTGGAMSGMSCDKSGAAAVVGFLRACDELQPRLRVVGALALVRNSIGADAYVADELLRTRTGAAVRVGNTDAEGRLAMADLLDEMRTRAAHEKNPHIFTIATLTGHAYRTVGRGYSIYMDNIAARRKGAAAALAAAGETLGEGGDESRVRREDFAEHAGKAAGDDLHQAGNLPSSAMPRGHQAPAAFLMLAAGLAAGDVPYTHIDIAASAGELPRAPTAAPLLTLADYFGLIKH